MLAPRNGMDIRSCCSVSGVNDPGRGPQLHAVAYVVPGWPPSACQNGIVSYTHQMRTALAGCGVDAFVLVDRTACCDSGGRVLGLGQFAEQSGLWRQVCRRVAWIAHRKRFHVQIRAAQIQRAIDWLQARNCVQLLQMEETWGCSRYVARNVSIPVVVRLHGPWFLSGDSNGVARDREYNTRVRLEGLACRDAVAVTAPSQDVLNRVRSHYGLALEHAAVIPNPISVSDDTLRWSPATANQREILFIGRMDRTKGIDIALLAVARLFKSYPDVKLVVVGPEIGFRENGMGMLGREALLAPERLGGVDVRDSVEWVGVQPYDALNGFRRRAFVTIVPSRYETFGNTALEAMALGCPVVVSAVGGLREVVTDERNGLTFEPEKGDDLARQIARLFDEPDLAARLGARATRDISERFSPARIADRTCEFYRSVLQLANGVPRRQGQS